MTVYNLNEGIPSTLATGDILNCPYSGERKVMRLPKGVFKLEVWGAQGGYRTTSTFGGMGGYSVGTLTLNEPRDVFLYAGGSGQTGGVSGGFNGGGLRATYNGGGGGSDIRLGQDSLYARVIVAGGGGSDGSTTRIGGAGGGTSGQANQSGGNGTNRGAGAQTSSGSSSYTADEQSTETSSLIDTYGGFGFGGNGVLHSGGYGGAGGGGWYGGAGTYPDSSADDDKSGSGGSGYIFTTSTKGSYPEGCLLTDDDLLTDASTTLGTTTFTSPTGTSEQGHLGDGYVRITILSLGSSTATWVADEEIIRVDEIGPYDVLNPPDVSKPSYFYVWQVGGVTIRPSKFKVLEDTTFTAHYFQPHVPELLCKIWDGDPDEYFTYRDMNRVERNTNILARECELPQTAFIETVRSSMFRYDEAQKLEDLLQTLADFIDHDVTMEENWGAGRTVSYVDFERWESTFWIIYKAFGGEGERIPSDKRKATYSAILYAGRWKGWGPYYQDLELGVTSDMEGLFYVAHVASLDSRLAEYNAVMRAGIVRDGVLRVYAIGIRPTVDIPVRISLGGLNLYTVLNIRSDDWQGTGPYTTTVTLADTPLNATLGAWEGMSDEAVESMTNGIISVSGISGHTVTLRCLGDKPTITLNPIIMWEKDSIE